MRVAITGTTGRVGEALARHFCREHEVIRLPRAEFDFSDPEAMSARLAGLDCEVLLNPGGLTSLEACEHSPELARQLNAEAPARLAEWATRRGVKLVHFSTDYVFSGREPGLRVEAETPEPLSVYGATKLAGEQAVLAHSGHLVVRISWVFGPEKPSFVDSVLRDALAGRPLVAVADKWSLPTHTADLSRWIEVLLNQGADGLFHACQSGEPASWHDLAELVVEELFRSGRLAERPEVRAQVLADVAAFRAERPFFTAMSNEKLQLRLQERIRDWRNALREHVSECR